MKLSELLSSPIKLIGGGFLNLKGFSKRVVDQELPKEITIDDIINFYTYGKIKKLSDLNTIITSEYNINTCAAATTDVLFPYAALDDYSDNKPLVADMINDINTIATNGYFLMKAYSDDKLCCLCEIYGDDSLKIKFICPVYSERSYEDDCINLYSINSDTMHVNYIITS